jgi:hypothetical protein
MSDLNWWEPAAGAMRVIIDSLPRKTQQRIVEQLQLLAQVQADKGELQASYFSRMLSGEPYPQPKPKPNLKIVK